MIKLGYRIFLIVLLISCHNKSENKGENKDFLPQAEATEIPFADTLNSNWVTIKAIVNNKPAYLILDNGTDINTELMLFKHYAISAGVIDSSKNLGLEVNRIMQQPMPITIGDISDSLHAEILHIPNAPLSGLPDGLLGKGFLIKHIIELDYKARLVKIHDTLNFRIPMGYKPILLKPLGQLYALNADLFLNGKKIPEQLCLDLGSSSDGLHFGIKYYRKYKNQLKINTDKTGESYAMFSKSKYARALLDSIAINGWKIRNLPSTIQVETTHAYESILFGNSVLKQAGKIFLDFKNNRIYLPVK